ncbi:chromatin modification-related protein EAF7-like [Malania oleifera]|uniref:chromatin modification-related protein EAF7-like n=1 Tax=Malania oleifera TaxID=397392 RepID=UPI0025ADB540|nr:chromatin modification-related protein EAF7-like [Malania oleifera]
MGNEHEEEGTSLEDDDDTPSCDETAKTCAKLYDELVLAKRRNKNVEKEVAMVKLRESSSKEKNETLEVKIEGLEDKLSKWKGKESCLCSTLKEEIISLKKEKEEFLEKAQKDHGSYQDERIDRMEKNLARSSRGAAPMDISFAPSSDVASDDASEGKEEDDDASNDNSEETADADKDDDAADADDD